MMEQRRDTRNGFDRFWGNMRGERPDEFGRDERDFHAIHSRHRGGWGSHEGCGDGHDHHDIRGFLMKRFGGHMGHMERFANMRRGVFDPHGFLEKSFKIDIQENEGEYLVQAKLPGVKKELILLERLPGMLVITVEVEGEKTERPLFLAHCDEEKICARHSDGVLEIRIPRSKGQKIEIS